MTILAAGKVNYRARIERAALLAERHEFAGHAGSPFRPDVITVGAVS